MDLIKKEQLYEGKAKKVFATQDSDYVIVSYMMLLLLTGLNAVPFREKVR